MKLIDLLMSMIGATYVDNKKMIVDVGTRKEWK